MNKEQNVQNRHVSQHSSNEMLGEVKRNDADIQRQVKGLELEKEWMPDVSKYGPSVVDIINAQIRILTKKKREPIPDNSSSMSEFDADYYDAKEEAWCWLIGENQTDLFMEA